MEDASEDERFSEFLSVHALKLRSVLCVPLMFRGDVKGVLYLDNRFTRGTFQEEDRDILQTFADLGAIALVNIGRWAVISPEVSRSGTFLGALVVLAFVPVAGVAQDPIARAEVSPAGAVTVGQPVTVTVSVFVPTFFQGPPAYSNLEVDDAFVIFNDRGSNLSQRIGRVTWAGQSRSYTIYPQRPGVFEIAAIPVEVRFRGSAGTVVATASPPPLRFCDNACDINGDRMKNIADAVYLLNFLFVMGPPPPPPFPGCGRNDNDALLGCESFIPCR